MPLLAQAKSSSAEPHGMRTMRPAMPSYVIDVSERHRDADRVLAHTLEGGSWLAPKPLVASLGAAFVWEALSPPMQTHARRPRWSGPGLCDQPRQIAPLHAPRVRSAVVSLTLRSRRTRLARNRGVHHGRNVAPERIRAPERARRRERPDARKICAEAELRRGRDDLSAEQRAEVGLPADGGGRAHLPTLRQGSRGDLRLREAGRSLRRADGGHPARP